jgi:hypothetical protein
MQDSLRRRFSSALRWYIMLVDTTSAFVQTKIELTREFLLKATEDDAINQGVFTRILNSHN